MGIQGLLPLLKSIMVPIHIKDLEGCSVAVDTYSWLHKGALSCSKDLCNGKPTSKHIKYCMHRVNLLRHYGVKPILVFDGGHLPMKNEQEIKRARSRKENLERAIEHESCGNASAAYECYQKAVDISPAIAYELIQVLKQESISYVVAPYEADAQMTFLALSKQVHAVITEDSDLIPFGCPRIIYKMDKFGQGVEFQYCKLQHNKELNLTGFTKQMILEMCILSGCDYLQSLPGMGLKKAHALIKKFNSYEKAIKHVKFSGIVVPPLYEESFRKAIMTFQHQRVYDPLTEDIIHLSDLSENIDEDLDFLGPFIPRHIAKGIASGDIDPLTRLPIQGECARAGPLLDGTYSIKSFKSGGESKKLDLPAQKNLLTNYFCFASLEAKRKFRAPRVSPNDPNPTNEVPQSLLDIGSEAESYKTSYSLTSKSDLEDVCGSPPQEEPVDNVVAKKASVLLESLSHDDMRNRHLIHPCVALQKERESNSSLDASEGKTRLEKKTVIVRSSYFKHKSVKENDHEKVNANLSVNSASDASEGETRVEKKTVIIRSSYFNHKSSKGNDQERLKVNLLANSALDASDGNMRKENSRGIVSSSYFKQKNMTENDQRDKMMNLSVGDVAIRVASESTTFEREPMSVLDSSEVKTRVENGKSNTSSYFQHKNQENRNEKHVEKSSGNVTCGNHGDFDMNYNEGSTMKRKVHFDDETAQQENLNHKYIRTSQSPGTEVISGGCISDLEDQMPGTRDKEDKFGCNISHLGQYSDIAEKSMEKFVSVLSSFRCNSSGSRASGLRAPLKDVRNTCTSSTSRSSSVKDITKFAYVPAKRKASLPPCRR